VLFIEKKGILYRSYSDKRGDETRLELVVPQKLRQRVLSMEHDTLLGVHRGVAKTQDRVISEFYWPGIDIVGRVLCVREMCPRVVWVVHIYNNNNNNNNNIHICIAPYGRNFRGVRTDATCGDTVFHDLC